MIVDDAVEEAAREARAVLAERGKSGFHGSVELKYRDDRIVTIEIRETVQKR